MFITYKA